ncbi:MULTISPECIES: hypothetical protein [Sandaracinus]|uniref:hypothetical protein n=1 Tax=Sandaracinus TaxID=1055688 RepID=UPI0019D442C3|nr:MULTISPECIES: hypothetical protein [Sandaracinus]QRN75788.1 Hypothetical protein MSR10575_88750 [Sandaracinus sp.]UJR87305.1 Hypothetical protein I5071_970 [Sandaracinus amylolyticus]
MPILLRDALWACARVRVEQTPGGGSNVRVLRTEGFEPNGELVRPWSVEGLARPWALDGAAAVHLRLSRFSQLDPGDSFVTVQTVRPSAYPYVEQLEVEHRDDGAIAVYAWPWLRVGEGPDASLEAPPCAFEVDVLVMRVAARDVVLAARQPQ